MSDVLSEQLKARVGVEQFRASLRLARLLTLTGATLPVPLFFMLLRWTGANSTTIVLWLGQYYVCLAIQFGTIFYGIRSLETAKMGTAMLLRDIFRFIGGISMGSIALLAVHPKDPVLGMFCLLVLLGIMSANVMDGYGLQRTFLSFVVPMTGIAMVSSLSLGGRLMVSLMIACPVFCVVLAGVNWQVGQVITEGIELRIRLEEANVVLADRAETDELTGLANRLAMKTLLAEQSETPTFGAVLFMDLDGFKQVNDVHGHEAGDMVLRIVAKRIQACIHSDDVAVRLGGDEFLVLAAVTEPALVEQISDRIHAAIRQPITISNGTVISVGTSIGSAMTEGFSSVSAAISSADHRMYVAKAVARRERLNERSNSGDARNEENSPSVARFSDIVVR
jgi:diguanylate cyclase (GGDEF)-like protein